MEAVIAAIYHDGGFDAARAAILRLWGARINNVADDARDAKTALQELSLIHISEPTRQYCQSRMPSSA